MKYIYFFNLNLFKQPYSEKIQPAIKHKQTKKDVFKKFPPPSRGHHAIFAFTPHTSKIKRECDKFL